MPVQVESVWLWRLVAAGGLIIVTGMLWRGLVRACRGGRGRPLVSLLIVARNKERFIEGLVRGLVTLGAGHDLVNYEVVAVDDHSTDETPAILERLGRHHDNLRVVRAAEVGKAGDDALRLGLFVCASPIVILLCLEGNVHPRMLMSAVRQLLGSQRAAAAHARRPLRESMIGGEAAGGAGQERADRTSN